ncbi:hypothetical protein G3A42_42730, partial [Paraburkholderia aspalathi]|nr:hypothetical protein [Paraburkholderia aspalathi]
ANQQHTAHHHGDDVVVRYPFHPRFGERINVIGMNRYRGESYLIIKQPDGTRAHLPPWMTGEEAAHMRVVSQPELPYTVLVELQRLIDAALSSCVLSTHGRYSDTQTGDQAEGPFRGGQQRKAFADGDAIGSGDTTDVADAIGNRRDRDGGAR